MRLILTFILNEVTQQVVGAAAILDGTRRFGIQRLVSVLSVD